MNIEEKTRMKTMMLIGVQLFLETHDELKDTTDYTKRLKFTAREFKKELRRSLDSQVGVLFEQDHQVELVNGIIEDVETYVNEILKDIKK
tara:strand:- start:4300 stop:4569 length:270 start_codon:yes stop_codon:yes gene_type:complete